jgi:hypothetical protein
MTYFRKLKITSIFENEHFKFPSFFERIDKNNKETGVNIVLIDGRGQAGKSTLADFIAKRYDKNYKLVYTVEEIIDRYKKLAELWLSGDYINSMYRWTFWDEPQLEVPRMAFWSDRNMIAQQLSSSFGFLKPSLIMALPNIKGLSDMILTNILFRITVNVHTNDKDEIVRKGYIKKPKYSESRNKFYWTGVETYTIPDMPELTQFDSEYMKAKVNNFLNVQLKSWEQKLGIGKKFDMPLSTIIEKERWTIPD